MMQATYDKFYRVAKLYAGRYSVDPDDLLQDVLLSMYERGLDPEENQGLVIRRLKFAAIDEYRTRAKRPESLTDFSSGWPASVEPKDRMRPGRDILEPGTVEFEPALAGASLVEFVRRYIYDILQAKLRGPYLNVAVRRYCDGNFTGDTYDRVTLMRARKRLSLDDMDDIAAWDEFNREQGRRRTALNGAPRLAQVLIREGLI
jgi:hypothetical protein